MPTPNYRQLFGPVGLPTVDGDVTQGLHELDVTRSTLAAVVKQSLIDDLSAAWATTVATLPAASHLRRSPTPSVVGTTMEVEPTEKHLQQFKVEWPLLAVYRTGDSERVDLTLEVEADRQRWHIEWILGPLGLDDVRRIGDATKLVSKVIQRAIRRSWAAGLNDGALKLHDLGVVEAKVLRAQTGQLETESGGLLYGVRIELEVTEQLRDDTTADDDLDAADFDVSLEDAVAVLAQTDPA